MWLSREEPEVPDTIGDRAAELQHQQAAPEQVFTKEDVRRAKAAEQQRRRDLS
jgi:hypothetical protein